MTPATPLSITALGDHDSSSGLGGHETLTEEFSTPKSSNTPKIPERLPINDRPTVYESSDDHTDMLIQRTNQLNKAIRQRDMNSFQ